jgi:hypothetical protein
VGLVADNASTNTKMFKLLKPEGILSHEVPHPNDRKRKFFFELRFFTYHKKFAKSIYRSPVTKERKTNHVSIHQEAIRKTKETFTEIC